MTSASIPTRMDAASRSVTGTNTRSVSVATIVSTAPVEGPTSAPGSTRRWSTTPSMGETIRVSERRRPTPAACARREAPWASTEATAARAEASSCCEMTPRGARASARVRFSRARARAARFCSMPPRAAAELLGEVAREHGGHHLAGAHGVAAVDGEAREVAEHLGAEVDLADGAEVDGPVDEQHVREGRDLLVEEELRPAVVVARRGREDFEEEGGGGSPGSSRPCRRAATGRTRRPRPRRCRTSPGSSRGCAGRC